MTETFPLVTIVTPSYNQGEFIEATIRSVLDQNYPNLQYLVIDGGSKDQTLDILRKYEDRLSWISEKDKGQSDAINKGFKMAEGEIVAWLNSDDTYEPGAIQSAVDYFLKHPETALVYGEGDIIDRDGSKVKRFEATQAFDLWTLIHKWDYIMQPTTFFKREALRKVGYLNESLHWCMDWDLWIKLASEYEVGYIDRVLANSREYEETKTSTGGWKRFREIVSLMRKYGNQKYPPGYFLYGGSTLYTEFGKNRLTKKVFFMLMSFLHRWALHQLPIRYPDGWMGPSYRFYAPPNKSRMIIKIKSINKEVLPLLISISINKELKERIIIKEEESTMVSVDVKPKNTVQEVWVTTDNYYRPSKLDKGSNDSRRLSIIIEVFYEGE